MIWYDMIYVYNIYNIMYIYIMFIPHNKKERDMVVEGEKKGERERKNK